MVLDVHGCCAWAVAVGLMVGSSVGWLDRDDKDCIRSIPSQTNSRC